MHAAAVAGSSAGASGRVRGDDAATPAARRPRLSGEQKAQAPGDDERLGRVGAQDEERAADTRRDTGDAVPSFTARMVLPSAESTATQPGAAGAVGAPSAPAGDTSASSGAAPLPEARLAPHPASPQFAPALGHQVQLFLREGIQQARLHLNPEDMGPISLRVTVEGNTAQVVLTAEHATTRQALEQAMPMLASSLREDGLTLTGGGVFEQPRDSGRESQPKGDRPATLQARGGDAPAGEPVRVDAPATAHRRLGALDVYA